LRLNQTGQRGTYTAAGPYNQNITHDMPPLTPKTKQKRSVAGGGANDLFLYAQQLTEFFTISPPCHEGYLRDAVSQCDARG
jgi:hypothetical protein